MIEIEINPNPVAIASCVSNCLLHLDIAMIQSTNHVVREYALSINEYINRISAKSFHVIRPFFLEQHNHGLRAIGYSETSCTTLSAMRRDRKVLHECQVYPKPVTVPQTDSTLTIAVLQFGVGSLTQGLRKLAEKYGRVTGKNGRYGAVLRVAITRCAAMIQGRPDEVSILGTSISTVPYPKVGTCTAEGGTISTQVH